MSQTPNQPDYAPRYSKGLPPQSTPPVAGKKERGVGFTITSIILGTLALVFSAPYWLYVLLILSDSLSGIDGGATHPGNPFTDWLSWIAVFGALLPLVLAILGLYVNKNRTSHISVSGVVGAVISSLAVLSVVIAFISAAHLFYTHGS